MDEKKRLKEIIKILKDSNILNGITPSKFCNIIESLGPTFIKIGQIMSNRVDIFPKEYCNALSRLRSNVTPMEFSEVEEILSNEYGDYREIFSYIDTSCIGSASIAQVHKAILTTGEDVVIKVQRKNIYEKMAVDVKLLKKAISLLHLNNIFKIMDLNEVVDQMFNVAKEEMNFIIEASHIEEFNNNNKDIVYVRAPQVYSNLVTSKVLVMEDIKGVVINKTIELEGRGYDLNEIGLKVCNNYIKQAIDDGFFHADPHSDNIMILDGQIVFIDLGMMGRLTKRDRMLLKKCIKAIVKNDIYEIERILLDLSTSYGEVNHIKLRRDIESILSKNADIEIKNTNTVNFVNSMFNMLQNNNIRLDKNITMLIRGIGVIEGMLEIVSPDISLLEVLANKIKEDSLNEIFNKDNAIKLGQDIINNSNSIIKIPNETLKLLNAINRGEVSFNVELNDSHNKIDKLEKMLHMIVIGLLDASLILGATLVSNTLLRNIYLLIALILTIWLFIKMYLDHID
jgi:ubiquinone biosynthesis protein